MHAAFITVVATWLAASGSPEQSIQTAEAAADRCMFQVALDFLADAPADEQTSRKGRMLKARLLIQLKRGAEGIDVLDSLGPSGNSQEEAARLLALALAQSADSRVRAAEQTLDRASKAGADRDLIDSARATVRIQQRRFAEAEKLLRAVLRRAPLLSGALYNLAVVRLQDDDLAEAAALIRQAWHAGLQDPNELKNDPDLRKLRETKGLIDDLLSAPVQRCGAY